MDVLWLSLGSVLAAAGAVVVAMSFRAPVVDVGSILADLEAMPDEPEIMDSYDERLSEPLLGRFLRPAGERLTSMLRGALPGTRMERIRVRLVQAGLGERIGAEEFIALQAVSLVLVAGLGAGVAFVMGWGTVGLTRSVAIFAALGFLAPVNWVQRNRERRLASVRRDLPDVLDLMAISVEAGVGLEGAIDVVTEHFDTPLAHEMGRLLREMELGLSRRAALQSMKARLGVPEVGNFVLSLVQADALGMPLGRVLRAQANEMRMRRRQWARERAARLPVKIVFPLMLFILPALFVVVLGPAVMSIGENIL